MQHDQVARELHFSHREMVILGIEFSPQPDKFAGDLLKVAKHAGMSCVRELEELYIMSEFDSARRQFDPAVLRAESSFADGLALQLASADDFVRLTTVVLPPPTR